LEALSTQRSRETREAEVIDVYKKFIFLLFLLLLCVEKSLQLSVIERKE